MRFKREKLGRERERRGEGRGQEQEDARGE